MSKKEAFICPFCGAPYRTLIPTGAVQVECQYCKSTILVPPRLGGVVKRCPNHPDVLAVGLCNDCGNSYCDRCLYVYKVRDGKLHVCSECYQKRQNKKIFGAVSVAIIMLCLTLAAIPKPPVAGAFFFLFIMFAFVALYEHDIGGKPLSIHDSR